MGTTLLMLTSYLSLVLFLAWIMGYWLAAIAQGRLPTILAPFIRAEQALYRLAGINAQHGMSWQEYAKSLLLFNSLGIIVLYLLQRWQGYLGFNPQALSAVGVDSAINTAVSFVTNTNWQGYGGESTMSYLVQMLGLTVQNFLSAATGIAVAFALIRGLAGHCSQHLGNFFVDITRITLYLLLPLALVLAMALMSEGVIQNLAPYQTLAVLDPLAMTQNSQTLAMGPVASQEAIKMLGTNGGGFFNANSAHPFENPTLLTNWLEMTAMLLIPAGLCFAFGRLLGDMRQGIALLSAMSILLILFAGAIMTAEQQHNPLLLATPVDQNASPLQAGGNMEGKEVRFGIQASALFSALTTATSCGAVNAMHDSLMPLGGLVTLWLMQLGEVVFGGVGSGLYGMIIMALLAVFIAGLMVGRTPEYLGKKIEPFEMKMITLIVLITPLLVLGGTALSLVLAPGQSSMSNPGAHGLSQVLYAFTSAGNNNGSAFAGFNSNTPFYNLALAGVAWSGRFISIVAVLAIAGSLAAKKKLPVTGGTLPTQGVLFVVLLTATVLLLGALTYLPILVLGPIAEHLQLFATAAAL